MGKPLNEEQARARAAKPATHAISIDAPWAWGIAHADKRAENRSWWPGAAFEGARVAIAATARAASDDDRAWLLDACGRDFVVPETDDLETGAIVATARIVAFGHVDKSGHVVITGRMPDVSADRCLALAMARGGIWCHVGTKLWILDEVRRLTHPIACKGAQRLWRMPPKLAVAVELAHVELGWEPKG